MNRKNYNKIPTTHEQQIDLLVKRGLAIPDRNKALRYLNQISYYRLSAYFSPYQTTKDAFIDGVEFGHLIQNYSFDRELRLLVFDCIERIEIAIRSQMTHILAHNYNNSHWQDDSSIFAAPYINKWTSREVNHYEELQQIIRKSFEAKTPEVFIKHYKDSYKKPVNPPSWMCMELLTIGELSRLFVGLKHTKDKQQIASFFGLYHTVFESWLHTLTYVRNICAHHARLWNREYAIRPNILAKPKFEWISKEYNNNQRTFYFLCLLKYLLVSANPNNSLSSKLDNLLKKYPQIPIQFIGIPSDGKGNLLDWKQEPLWK